MSASQESSAARARAENPGDVLSAFTAAYERRLPAILALKDSDLATLNVDVHASTTTALGALPKIRAFTARIAALGDIDQSLIEGLEDYAQAASEAHSRYVTALVPRNEAAALQDEALKTRRVFRADAEALAARGLIDRARLAPFKNRSGYRNLAFELIDYANLLRDCWPMIQGRTGVLAEEIQRAKELGEELVLAVANREQGAVKVAETEAIRHRAVTLFLKAYDETRRAVKFLRWRERDAETIVPSLYRGRGGRGKKGRPRGTELSADRAGAATPTGVTTFVSDANVWAGDAPPV
jgi:hypothetical protein